MFVLYCSNTLDVGLAICSSGLNYRHGKRSKQMKSRRYNPIRFPPKPAKVSFWPVILHANQTLKQEKTGRETHCCCYIIPGRRRRFLLGLLTISDRGAAPAEGAAPPGPRAAGSCSGMTSARVSAQAAQAWARTWTSAGWPPSSAARRRPPRTPSSRTSGAGRRSCSRACLQSSCGLTWRTMPSGPTCSPEISVSLLPLWTRPPSLGPRRSSSAFCWWAFPRRDRSLGAWPHGVVV